MKNYLYNGIFFEKKILITGHTGFKGSWLSLILHRLGANVYGYALEPPTNPSLFKEAKIRELITSYTGDVRDLDKLSIVFQQVKPEIVIHMAAQPLVRDSYRIPVETYSINMMGTVNVLEACRRTNSVKVILNITTDKCYENKEWHWGYRENDPLGGYDPYSNSKACSELITSSYRDSFYNQIDYDKHKVAIATARAGNVIGGGDWAVDRLIPDFIRAISHSQEVVIRSPLAIRPWQHVLEPLNGYLLLAANLYEHGAKFNGGWNFGPEDKDARNVEWITNTICKLWNNGASYRLDTNPQPHEANYLKLDCSKAKTELGWEPKWNIHKTLESIVMWNKSYLKGDDIRKTTESQIEEYFNE
ncbi:CDP-glucose 4,6-dehydratase [bioreactor metagenome]|uniref:CDP-glucose 4,6-dehydratase n=1 Tax=bioreactor metagenome TaxID=1076179 RepID=A0A644VQN7_9ZZZZ